MRSQDSHNRSDKLLGRSLNQEERQWVRQLDQDPGFRLYLQALQELLANSLIRLKSEKDHAAILRLQGQIAGLELALGIPSKLRERAVLPVEGM